MSLTLGRGPLVAKDPPESNYEIEGPAHRILWGAFPRRVRAELDGVTIFDTVDGRLLHESQILPRLYVPEADVRTELLEPTETETNCPFKGDASYWSVKVGDRVSLDAAWAYPDPLPEAPWLRGHFSFYPERLDAWFDEDERVHGHLRDPFHRVDVRPTSRRVVVSAGGTELAASTRAMVLSETGLPNRLYLPLDDIAEGLLRASEKSTHCPYKGDASYFSVSAGERAIEDAAFSYAEPFDDAIRVSGMVSFLHDEIEVEIDPPSP